MAVIYDGQGQGGIVILISERHTDLRCSEISRPSEVYWLYHWCSTCTGCDRWRRHTDLDAKLRNKIVGHLRLVVMWPAQPECQ